MKRRKRISYTETDKALMWDRWQKGESLRTIAHLFNRHHSSIAGILSRTGGIRPPNRSRSVLVLTLPEREEISRGIVAGDSVRLIAASLSRSPSTVSREIKRNGGRRRYRAKSRFCTSLQIFGRHARSQAAWSDRWLVKANLSGQ